MTSGDSSRTSKRTAEDESQSPTKRIKEASSELEDESPEEMAKRQLHGDLSGVLMGFLDVRDLMKFVFLKKGMLRFLTYEHAVRAGLMYNRYSKTTVERIVADLDRIHVPTPLRLLRLANGKRCERCHSRKVKHISVVSGLFLCNDNYGGSCADNCMVLHNWAEPPPFLKHVVHHHLPRRQYWLFDNLGELQRKSGTLITDTDVTLQGQNAEKVQQLLIQRQENDPNRKHAACIKDIAETYRAQASRRQEERDDSHKKKLAKAVANKKKKIRLMLGTLSTCWDGKPWKDIVLSHTWAGEANVEYLHRSHEPIFSFQLRQLDSRMRPFLVTPSKVRQASLREIAAEVSQTLSIVYEHDLHNFSFFDEDDPFEKIWKAKLLSSIRTEERVIQVANGLAEKVRNGGEFVTIQKLVVENNTQNASKDAIFDQLVRSIYDCSWIPAGALSGVLSSTPIPENRQRLAEGLAEKIWAKGSECNIRQLYRHCCTSLPVLFQSALDFISMYKLDENTNEVNFPRILDTFCKDDQVLQFLRAKKLAAVWRRAVWLQQRYV